MTVLILGGGISGLSAAYYLTKKLPPALITLWEASERTGGWIKSRKNENGILFEQSARTLRPRFETGANTLNLVEELDLSDNIHPILSNSPAAKNRMIYVNGNLYSLPSSLLSCFKKTPPFSKPLIKAFLNEHKMPSKKLQDDSIYNFMERRLGKEIADYLMSPLICGICAGNAKEISVNFLAERLFKYEQMYGSITRGLFFDFFKFNQTLPTSKLYQRMKQEKWSVYSFKNGLETLPKRLHEVIDNKGVKLNLNTKCTNIEFSKNEVILFKDKEMFKTKHLISTLQSEQLGELIVNHNELKNLLNQIKSVNVAVINLLFNGNILENQAFGFLVPPKENLPILGVIYDSCCFDQKNNTVLTVMMGGYWFDKHFNNFKTDDEFYSLALEYLKKILKIKENPKSYKVSVLEKCIPQYNVGHKGIVKKINEYILKEKLPLSLTGMSFNGVGVNDVILSSKKSVENLNI